MDLTKTANAALEADALRRAEEAEAKRLSVRSFNATLLKEKFREVLGVELPAGEVCYIGDQATMAWAVVDGKDLVLAIGQRGTNSSYVSAVAEDRIDTNKQYVLRPYVRVTDDEGKTKLETCETGAELGLTGMPQLAQVLAKKTIPIGYSTTRRDYVPGKGIQGA